MNNPQKRPLVRHLVVDKECWLRQEVCKTPCYPEAIRNGTGIIRTSCAPTIENRARGMKFTYAMNHGWNGNHDGPR